VAEERQYEVALEQGVAAALGLKGFEREEIPGMVGMMIVLGATNHAERRQAYRGQGCSDPRVNLGGLGFITEINKG